MNVFSLLLKNEFRNSFASLGVKLKTKTTFVAVTIVAAVLALAYSSLIAVSTAISIDATTKAFESLLLMGIVLSSLIVFGFNIFSGFGSVYKSRDYNFIKSLPIKPEYIFFSKYLTQIIMQYAFVFVAFVPFVSTYFAFAGFSVLGLVNAIGIFLFLPFLPIILGLLIGMIVNIVFGSSKKTKMLGTILGSLALITFVVVMSSPDLLTTILSSGIDFVSIISSIFILTDFGINAIADSNVLNMLWFVLINVSVIGLFTILCSKFYHEMYGYFNRQAKQKVKTELIVKNTSAFKMLVKREFLKLTSSAVYLLNFLTGPIVAVVMGVSTVGMLPYMPGLPSWVGVILIVSTLGLMTMLSTPLNVSISLENKTFYLIKNLPITPKQYFMAKLVVYGIINIPFVLIATIVFGILLNMSLWTILAILCLGLCFVFISGFAALLLSRKFYNFNYTNETQLFKYSAAAGFQALIGMGSMTIVGLGLFGISLLTNILWGVVAFVAIGIIVSIILGKQLFNYTNHQLNEIQ